MEGDAEGRDWRVRRRKRLNGKKRKRLEGDA